VTLPSVQAAPNAVEELPAEVGAAS
jgi:hypothetical protein